MHVLFEDARVIKGIAPTRWMDDQGQEWEGKDLLKFLIRNRLIDHFRELGSIEVDQNIWWFTRIL